MSGETIIRTSVQQSPRSAVGCLPLREGGHAALAQDFGDELLVGRRAGTTSTASLDGSDLCGRLRHEHGGLHTGLPVLIQLANDVVQTLPGETAAEVHRDDVAVDQCASYQPNAVARA